MTKQNALLLAVGLFIVGGVVALNTLVVGVVLIVAAVAVLAWSMTLNRTQE